MFTQNIQPNQSTLIPLQSDTHPEVPRETQKNFEAVLRGVCEQVAPIWPLANFIAVNPLQGFEKKSFREAVEIARALYHAKGVPDLGYFHDQFKKGRIVTSDLVDAIKKLNPEVSVESLMKILVEEASQDEGAKSDRQLSDVFLVLSEWADQLFGTKLYPLMQSEVSKWAGAYFDRGEAAWSMPGREKGFFAAWRDLVLFEKGVELAGLQGFRDYVRKLPENNIKAIEKMMADLGVPEKLVPDYLMRHFASAPGWAGLFLLNGRENQFSQGQDSLGPLLDYLAMRLSYDVVGSLATFGQEIQLKSPWQGMLFLANEKLPKAEDKKDLAPSAGLIWLEAFERNYRSRLLDLLQKASQKNNSLEEGNVGRPTAQAVFCIDVRSEAFRRNLEVEGSFDTYGFAGFFAIPLAHQEFGGEEPSPQCPVLIRPKYLVLEKPNENDKVKAARVLNHRDSSKALDSALHEVKNTSVSPFALVETFGGLGFFSMYFKSFAPQIKKGIKAALDRVMGIDLNTFPQLQNIPAEDQVAIAENSLRIMGLLKNFGRLVLLCGHGSTTTNNAYATALDCGACGGHRGAPNARVAAQIFNDQKVRNALELRGISIPADTVFIAGEHDTATDTITILDEESVPFSHAQDLSELKTALKKAGESLNLERTQRFDNPKKFKGEASHEVQRRSMDWSEARPEWGLAGNAAFIVAKRTLTKSLNLKSRSFLHSYDWESDTVGKALEVIMTAPMVVAEWINTQYYFSSVDNEVFGSGNKVIHNVVGKLGVMQGNVSDLKIGLPLQSVSNGNELVHEPMRLLVVIEAPRSRVQAIVQLQESVKKLVVNEWIRLVVLDPADGQFYRYSPQHHWELESGLIPQHYSGN
ncbi:MAG: DUF2309 domain-containing protein [Pseudomonadota bacterium]